MHDPIVAKVCVKGHQGQWVLNKQNFLSANLKINSFF
jgi:hypothetical protein